MSLLKGKTKAAVIRFSGECTIRDLLEKARKHAAPPFKDTAFREQTCGFAPGKILLGDEISEENSVFGNMLILNIRRTAKRMDPGLLKAQIQRMEAEYMAKNLMDFVPKKKRGKIKKDAADLLSAEKILTVKGMELAIVPDENAVVLETNSPGGIDLGFQCIAKDLGIFCNHPAGVLNLRRKFFTWLFRKSRENPEFTDELNVFIDGPMELFANEDCSNAPEKMTKAKIEGGMVTDSRELQMMLDSGKLLKKAHVSIHAADGVWNFTFDCDHFTFSGLELPAERDEDVCDRISAILKLHGFLEKLYAIYRKEENRERGEENLPGLEETE